MIQYRLVSGICLTGLVLGVFWLDYRLDTLAPIGVSDGGSGRSGRVPPGLPFLGLILLILPLAARELAAIFRALGIRAEAWMLTLAAVAIVLSMYLLPDRFDAATSVAALTSIIALAFFGSLAWHSRHTRIQGAVTAGAATTLAATYLGALGGFYPLMRREHSAWLLLAIILTTKAADIGGYAFGKLIGRHKAFPWLSPGKTWEGILGGIVLSVLTAVAFVALAGRYPAMTTTYATIEGQRATIVAEYSYVQAVIAGTVIAIVSVLGGMALSLFKRDSGLKDSGASIPGMGGVLDVLDTPLIVGPVAYWMLELA